MSATLPVADEMTSSQREAYERESLAELEKLIESWRPAYDDILVRELRLTGSYPDTAIFVRWLDTRSNNEKEGSYPLWIVPATGAASFEYAPNGKTLRRMPPSQVALSIHTWFTE